MTKMSGILPAALRLSKVIISLVVPEGFMD